MLLPPDQKKNVDDWKCSQSITHRISNFVQSAQQIFSKRSEQAQPEARLAPPVNEFNMLDPFRMLDNRNNLIAKGVVSSDLAIDMRLTARKILMQIFNETTVTPMKSKLDKLSKKNNLTQDETNEMRHLKQDLAEVKYKNHEACNKVVHKKPDGSNQPAYNAITDKLTLGDSSYTGDDDVLTNLKNENITHVYGFTRNPAAIEQNRLDAKVAKGYNVNEPREFSLKTVQENYKGLQDFLKDMASDEASLNGNNKLYIHCQMGKNRSALRATIALMADKKLTADEALAVINDGRDVGLNPFSISLLKICDKIGVDVDIENEPGKTKFTEAWKEEYPNFFPETSLRVL